MKRIFLIIIVILIIYTTTNISKKNSFKVNSNNNLTKMNVINETTKTKINIYIPYTEYPKLNRQIKEITDYYLSEFQKEITNTSLPIDIYNTIYILYDEYYYQEYISIILYIETFTGGAHPNHTIKSIIYNKKTNNFITIDTLYEQNPNILNELSTISREILKKNPQYNDKQNKETLYNGTSPNKENFSNLAITKLGLKIYFNYYQIAPYYYGSSEITIPYNQLNLNI